MFKVRLHKFFLVYMLPLLPSTPFKAATTDDNGTGWDNFGYPSPCLAEVGMDIKRWV